MAAPAHVITLSMKSGVNQSIRAWFRDFNFLPPIPLTAGHIDTVTVHVSFEDLLKRLAASSFQNFILIIHGYEDGSGLYIPLAPDQRKAHREHYDLQKLMDVDAGVSKMSHADTVRMGISKAHIDNILDLMHQVRRKNIHCIEFRSCNLGKNILSLGRFRQFFGARLAGAPDLHTLFGEVPVLIGADFLKHHYRLHAGGNWETYKFPNALRDPQLVACFQLNADQKPEYGGHIAADTTATVDAWIKEFVMNAGGRKGKEMGMHGLWIADRRVVSKGHPDRFVPAAITLEKGDLKDPLGGWGGPVVRRLIPPLSENYGKHIIYSR